MDTCDFSRYHCEDISVGILSEESKCRFKCIVGNNVHNIRVFRYFTAKVGTEAILMYDLLLGDFLAAFDCVLFKKPRSSTVLGALAKKEPKLTSFVFAIRPI